MILTIRLNDQASRHMRRFGQEVKNIAKMRELGAQVSALELRQAEHALAVDKQASSIAKMRGEGAAKLAKERTRLDNERQSILNAESAALHTQARIHGDIETAQIRSNRLARAHALTQDRIANLRNDIRITERQIRDFSPAAQDAARVKLADQANKASRKLATTAANAVVHNIKLNELTSKRLDLEKELVSERSKQGAATKALNKAEKDAVTQAKAARKAGITPAITGAPKIAPLVEGREAAVKSVAAVRGELDKVRALELQATVRATQFGIELNKARNVAADLTRQIEEMGGVGAAGTERLTQRLIQQRQQMSGLQEKIVRYGEDVETARIKQDNLRGSLNNTSNTLGAIPSKLTANSQAFHLLDEQVKTYDRDLADAIARQGVLDERLRQTNVRVMEMKEQLAGVRWDAVQRGSAAASHLGRSMMLAGAVGVGALALMANEAANFNTSVMLAATQMSDTADQSVASAKEIETAILGVMQRSTSSAMDLSDAMYNIFSSTNIQNVKEGTKFLQLMSDGAIAGMTNVKDVTDLAITVMNNFEIQTKDMHKTMDQMFAAVRFGRISFEEYSQSLSQVVPAAQAANQSFDDMNSAFAFTTRQLGVSFARTGLARLYELIERPEAVAGLQQLGVSVKDLRTGAMKPLQDIITQIAEKVPALAEGRKSAQAFWREVTKAGGAPVGQAGTVQAARVMEVMVSHTKELNDVTKEVTTTTGQFAEQLRAMEESSGVQFQEFKTQMSALAIEIGAAALPVLMQLGDVLASIAKWFNGLSPEMKKTIAQVVAATAVFTLLFGAVLAVVGGIAAMIVSMRVIKGALGGISGAGGVAAMGANLREVGNSSNTAGGKLKLFSSEVGSANTKLLKIGGTIGLVVAAIPLLTSVTGDLTSTLKILFDVILAFTVRTMIVKLLSLGAVLGATRLALLGVAGGPWGIVITIAAVGLYELINHIKELRDAGDAVESAHWAPEVDLKGMTIVKEMATALQEAPRGEGGVFSRKVLDDFRKRLGTTQKAADLVAAAITLAHEREAAALKKLIALRAEYAYQDRFLGKPGMTPADITAHAPEIVGGKYTDTAFQKHSRVVERMRIAAEKEPNLKLAFAAWQRYFTALKDLQNRSTNEQRQAYEMLPKMTDAAVLAAARNVEKLRLAAEKAPSIANFKKFLQAQTALRNKATQEQMAIVEAMMDVEGPTISSTAVLEAVKNLERLKQVAETAPSMANWEAYYTAQEQLSKQASNTQIQAAQATVDAMEATTPTLSNAAVEQMIRQAETMRKQLEKAPSAQGYMEYYALLDRISKLSTDNQRQAIEEYMRVQNQLVDDGKAKLKELQDSLISMYQNIRDENQNLFGELFAGPNMERLNDQVDKIKDIAKKKTDALRKQIDALQKTARDVDAATGNLIDWGLLPKIDVDAQVDALQDEIDKIDKTATAAADKLQKRLDEKRFTPKEMLNDLQQQVKAFINYEKAINALRKRGAPEALIEQLKAQGPEFLPAIQALAKMPPGMWNNYIKTFQTAQKLIDAQTQKDLKIELKKYQQRGKLIAQAVIDGITSQDARLQASIQRLIIKMFPELAGKLKTGAKAGAKPPPKGAKAAQQQQTRKAPAPAAAKKPVATTATHVTFNYHYHNEGGKGMGADTWFRRQSFRDRTKTKVC